MAMLSRRALRRRLRFRTDRRALGRDARDCGASRRIPKSGRTGRAADGHRYRHRRRRLAARRCSLGTLCQQLAAGGEARRLVESNPRHHRDRSAD